MQSNYLLKSIELLCIAFRMLGVSGHWGECKCISSMPNVCCAGHHWFSHECDDHKYLLFSSRVCLKEQFSIFTTQAMLKLPKLARSSHGNTSFIPGLSPLAGILLIHYCLVSLQPVFTCLLLICIQLHVKLIYNWNELCVNSINWQCTFVHHKSSIWYIMFL